MHVPLTQEIEQRWNAHMMLQGELPPCHFHCVMEDVPSLSQKNMIRYLRYAVILQ